MRGNGGYPLGDPAIPPETVAPPTSPTSRKHVRESQLKPASPFALVVNDCYVCTNISARVTVTRGPAQSLVAEFPGTRRCPSASTFLTVESMPGSRS